MYKHLFHLYLNTWHVNIQCGMAYHLKKVLKNFFLLLPNVLVSGHFYQIAFPVANTPLFELYEFDNRQDIGRLTEST